MLTIYDILEINTKKMFEIKIKLTSLHNPNRVAIIMNSPNFYNY